MINKETGGNISYEEEISGNHLPFIKSHKVADQERDLPLVKDITRKKKIGTM